MTFFNSEPLENPHEQPEGSPGRGALPLFRQDDNLPGGLPGSHVSLSAYISKHLGQEKASSEHHADPARPGEKKPPFIPTNNFGAPAYRSGLFAGPDGQRLNSLDVDLTAGLESYLPTPIFRLRVMKNRLDTEIADLRQKLAKYDRLPEQSKDMRERIEGLRHRLRTLETHEQQVSMELAAAYRMGPLFHFFVRQGTAAGNVLRRLATKIHGLLLGMFYGPFYNEMDMAGQELRDLQEIFAERLQDPHASDREIGQLMTRYEHLIQRMERVKAELGPAGLPQRLWQGAQRLLK